MTYEYFSVSSGDNMRFTNPGIHWFESGLGYRHNAKNAYEAVIVAIKKRDDVTEKYMFSKYLLFLKYKRYMNWKWSGNDF